jgi:hypothetical protein
VPWADVLTGVVTFRRISPVRDATRAPKAAYPANYTTLVSGHPEMLDDLGGGPVYHMAQLGIRADVLFICEVPPGVELKNGDVAEYTETDSTAARVYRLTKP